MNAQRLATAFTIALAVSGLCTWVLSRKMATHAELHAPELKYIAPARPLQAGEILKADSLEFVSWPADKPIADSFTKSDDLVGRSVLYPMDKDQPITGKFVSAPGSGVGLAGEVPQGMRAIALRSDEVMGVAGFLFPGSHVDVLVTFRSDKSPEPTTATVLQDAEILAAGQKTQPDPDGKPVTATVVTLLLTPDDAQKAVLASAQGAIHFVLRGGSDKAHVQEPPITLSSLSGYPGAPQTTEEPHVALRRLPEKHEFVVETIAGDKKSTASFREMR